MKLIVLPLLICLAYLGFENSDKFIDIYRSAYPADPVKRTAIEECALHREFNRLDPEDRQRCYDRMLPTATVAAIPVASPYYPYNPSHLPGNDVRRQEANAGFQLVQPASAEPLAVHPAAPPAPQPQPAAPVVYHPVPPHHPATPAHRVVNTTSPTH
jgi:hypothetical protein